jgi:hypothetical protein
MERMFSATTECEENVLQMVFSDIQKAKEGEAVDTDELKYEKVGDNQVMVTDKGNNETTIAEISEDGNVDLYNPEDAVVEDSTEMDGFLHPEVKDEVIPGNQKNPVDTVEEHLEEGVISPNLECGGKNPEAGCEMTVEEHAEECAEGECPEEKEDEQKEFSVYSDNTVVQKIFSQQEYCEMLFSEIIAEETEDVAKVGNLEIEKVDDDTLIVSDVKSGDQAKVLLTDDEMEVEELNSSKNFSEEGEQPVESNEQLEPLHVVGVDAGNHQLVDTSVFDEESANEIANRLSEAGVDAVEVFEDEASARDYAAELLENLGVESDEDIEEPTEATFSDVDGFECGVYVTKYYSKNTSFMDRLFSEAAQGIETSQAKIEDALENGDEIETEEEIVTPISATEAVVESKDNGEYTKVTIDDDNMKLDALTKEEANDLMDDIAVSEEEVDEDEQAEDVVEEAEDTAEQAEEDAIEKEDEEKDFSDVYTNEAETKFFSENEDMTQYMIRLFSDKEDEKLIEQSIESGNQIDNDEIKITPVDAETAIVEDKTNEGELTKAVLTEEEIELCPISEEEAKALKEDTTSEEEKKVEEVDLKEEAEKPAEKEEEMKEEKVEEEKEEKKFSNTILDKWFAEAVVPAAGIHAQPVAQEAPTIEFIVDENGNPIAPAEEAAAQQEEMPSVEAIEDKAVAAVQQIQAAAAEAEAAILNAKAAPVEGQEADLQEATFSEKENIEEKTFSSNNVLVSWLNGTQRN